MSVTTHERPGVYSEYDASSVVQGRQGRKMVGMAAIHATAPAGVPQTVTSYEGALIAFGSTGGQDMTELIRLALKNGAAGVVAVPVADDEGYEAAFAALAAMDDIGVVICDSVDREVQQSLRDSAAAASAARRERIAVAAGGAGETVSWWPGPRNSTASGWCWWPPGAPTRKGRPSPASPWPQLWPGLLPGQPTPPSPWGARCSADCMGWRQPMGTTTWTCSSGAA